MKTLDLTRHAAYKLATYDIEGDRLCSWRDALQDGDPFSISHQVPKAAFFVGKSAPGS